MRILVVDDEFSILEVLKAFLEADGDNEVEVAVSGSQALAMIDAADRDFQCVLLDIQMPTMNGIALCALIRENPDYCRVPIIMLTAMSQRPYIDEAFAAGATDYLTKPFDFSELRGRLLAASRIAEEYSRAVKNASEYRRLAIDSDADNKTHPDEPISIGGVERVIGYNALENYLLTLSRTRLLFASTFAISINDFKGLHDAATSQEIRSILKIVAQAIADKTPQAGNLVSYRGNGIYLCINQKKTAIVPNEIERQINFALSRSPSSISEKHEITISIGQEISLASFSRAGALLALRRAIDTLDPDPMSEKTAAKISKRVLRSNPITQEQKYLERRAYELALEDILREEGRQVG